ncbi:ankyrin repeat-containing domain protein [Aspergillus pseudoustus]|uniref:Ankyrin repeat-containing domain protein n=1 Tax=Aspergillus pseudoustus TaxID=1810923 RepID=A0ABR4KW24_9EURO
MPPHAARIPDAIWEQHREEIIAMYTSGSLARTMTQMSEKHGFQATENQYTRQLKLWGIKKYNSGNDWKLIARETRKRRAEGKESAVTMRGRKFTKLDREKEIARHVPLREQWSTSGDSVLPAYITVSTPPADPAVLVARQQSIGTGHFSLESEKDLPQFGGIPEFGWGDEDNSDEYLPPQWPRASRCRSRTKPGKKTTAVILEDFLQRFLFLAINNLLPERKFNEVCDWTEKTFGRDALYLLCQFESPPMRVFERRVLRRAVESGDVCIAGRLIRLCPKKQGDVNFQSRRWSQYLDVAINCGQASMVELLCQAGVPPKVNITWAWTSKSWEMHLPILQILLAAGAHPETFIANREPGFPLVNAAHGGSIPAVQLLLDAGARIDLFSPEYYGTALQAACWEDRLEMARYLVDYGADPNIPHILPSSVYEGHSLGDLDRKALQTPIQIAAKRNNVALVELLLQRGANASACPVSSHPYIELLSSQKPRRGAIHENTYLPYYTSPNYIHTSIQYATINQNLEMVGLLLSRGVGPDSRVTICLGDTALQISARLGNAEIFRLLLRGGADVNAPPGSHNGRTTLQGAAESGNFEILSILESLGVVGALINAPAGKKLGMTALQAACLNGHSLVAGFLLAHGADINAAPSSVAGCTAVQAASWAGDIHLIRDLIRLGARIGTSNTTLGTTALLASMAHKSIPILELLVNHGVDVHESADGELYTPIQAAAQIDWVEGVEFLLEHGSNANDVKVPPDGGALYHDIESPLRFAIANEVENSTDDTRMVALLLQHGADVLTPAEIGGPNPESSLMYALRWNTCLEIIQLLLGQVPELERHPGSVNALDLSFKYCRDDVTELILERTLSMAPSPRQEALQKAWDSLPDFRWMDSQDIAERIELLTGCGAYLDSRAADGSTFLQRSCRTHFHRASRILIENGAAVNTDAAECYGTPLQEALKTRNFKSAHLLLQHGADINALSAQKEGVTALQAAAMNGLFYNGYTVSRKWSRCCCASCANWGENGY